MDIPRRRTRETVASCSEADLYPHDVSLYLLPPASVISLTEFEELAVDRLKALRIIENVVLRGIKQIGDVKTAVVAEFNKQGLKYFSKLIQSSAFGRSEAEVQTRRKDHISHFILRLAYCRSEELRRWFVKQEMELFRIRCVLLSSEGIQQLLKFNHLKYAPISVAEKYALRTELESSTMSWQPKPFDMVDYYRVPINEVCALVRQRKCFVQKFHAYIPAADLIAVVSGIFRANLNQALVKSARMLPDIETDDRLRGLLRSLHASYTGKDDYTSGKTDIQIKNLDALSVRSYPLCMRNVHEHLRADHHLKHGARQMYSLFLKGIGVSLEDSLTFWRSEFTKKMDVDKFEKQYAYNVRHTYGKEGKRANYQPQNCLKIIMGSLGPGDIHGCPFRHKDLSSVTQQLASYHVAAQGIRHIENYIKGQHYQLACGKYYELVHGQMPDSGGINHPNQYFEESMRHFNAKGETNGKTAVVKKTAEEEWAESFDVSMSKLEDLV